MFMHPHSHSQTHTSDLLIHSSPSRILPLLVWNIHRGFPLNKAFMYALINTPATHSLSLYTGLYSQREENTPPLSPSSHVLAANTWERDERLLHSLRTPARDGHLKLHPLSGNRTINIQCAQLMRFPEIIQTTSSAFSADTPEVLLGRERWKCG